MSNYCQGVYVRRGGDSEPINLHRIAIQTEESRESRMWRKNRAPCFLLPNDEPAHGSQTMNFTMFLHISQISISIRRMQNWIIVFGGFVSTF